MDLNNLFNSDVFNESLDIEKLLSSDSSGGKGNVIYRPSLGKSGVTAYQATLKFLPDYKNPSRLWITNYEVFLTNQDTNTMKSVHCPSTLGKGTPSILQDAFFAFLNSDIAREKKLSKKMSRSERYYSLVQIIKDKQHPELEGKIMIFQYGVKIANKIKAIIKPDNEDLTANQPFDILKGRLFMLSMYQDGDFPNYDKSTFTEKTYPGLKIEGNDVKYNKENQKLITDFLVENTPDMSAFEYKPMTEEDKKFVGGAINSIMRGSDKLGPIKNKWPEFFAEGSFSSPDEDDDQYDDVLASSKTTKKSTKKPVMTDDEEDEVETFLKDQKSKPSKDEFTEVDDSEDDDIIDDDYFSNLDA